jgi:hypothetical protein
MGWWSVFWLMDWSCESHRRWIDESILCFEINWWWNSVRVMVMIEREFQWWTDKWGCVADWVVMRECVGYRLMMRAFRSSIDGESVQMINGRWVCENECVLMLYWSWIHVEQTYMGNWWWECVQEMRWWRESVQRMTCRPKSICNEWMFRLWSAGGITFSQCSDNKYERISLECWCGNAS